MDSKKIADALRDQADALRRLADAIEAQPAWMPFVTMPAGAPVPHVAPPRAPVTHPHPPAPSTTGPWWGVADMRLTC